MQIGARIAVHLVAAEVVGNPLLSDAHNVKHRWQALRRAICANAQVQLPRVLVLLERCTESAGHSVSDFDGD